MSHISSDTVEPGVSKPIDSKQPGVSKLFAAYQLIYNINHQKIVNFCPFWKKGKTWR